MSFRQLTTLAVLAMASFANAQKGVEVPAQQAVLGTDTVAGCFSSLGDMKLENTDDFNTQGSCASACRNKLKPVGATYAKSCYCGTLMPNKLTLLPDSVCNEPCPGFDTQACGGLDAFTVYNTGVQFNVAQAELPKSSTTISSSTTSAASSTSTTQTAAAATTSAASKPTSDGGSSKTIGIAVGIVVGVVAISAIVAGTYFYVRRKRNAQLEEEHRRNAAVSSFIGTGKPRSSGGMSIADSRMDPIMNRRMSDGSIADNQDYSRRILRVTNA